MGVYLPAVANHTENSKGVSDWECSSAEATVQASVGVTARPASASSPYGSGDSAAYSLIAVLSSAERSACDTGAWSLSRARAASTASEADKDLSIPLLNRDRPQPRGAIAGMLARADVVLVAVPRADDVQLVGEVVAEAAPLVVEALDHA